MATYLIHSGAENLRRADGFDTGVVAAADPAAAKARFAQLFGEPAANFDAWTAVDLAAMTGAVAVQGRPVGATNQALFPTLTRGGDRLRGS